MAGINWFTFEKILALFPLPVALLESGNFVTTLGLVGDNQVDLDRALSILVL